MNHPNLKICVVLLFNIGFTGLQAQKAIPAAGGEASGNGGSVSYSVGQVVYTAITSSAGTVTQGVQQPYEILEVTGIDNAKFINLKVTAYPNPTTDFLMLQVDEAYWDLGQAMKYHLFDMNGKLLDSELLESKETSIKMNDLGPAVYFLKIVQQEEEIKIFKIIKQ
jgi:hypothetical protein